MTKRFCRSILGACLLASWAPSARAVTVEFAFGGYVQSVLDTHGVLDGSIAMGTRLRGSARYDSALVDFFPAEPEFGEYAQPIPPGSFVVQLGSYTLSPPSPLRLGILNDFPVGETLVESFGWSFQGGAFPVPGAPGASFNLVDFRMDSPGTFTFATDALPTAPLDIADFPNREITRFAITGCLDVELSDFFCVPDETIAIYGIIDTVPEPQGVAGALAALAALRAIARFRRA